MTPSTLTVDLFAKVYKASPSTATSLLAEAVLVTSASRPGWGHSRMKVAVLSTSFLRSIRASLKMNFTPAYVLLSRRTERIQLIASQRGGAGNVYKEKYGGHSHSRSPDGRKPGLTDKVKQALHLDGKKEPSPLANNETTK